MATQRSAEQPLSAWNGSDALSYTSLLSFSPPGRGDGGRWRLVELYSRSQAPFNARLSWSGGRGMVPPVALTVPGATRVSIQCVSLSVVVANLSDAENRVGAVVHDGAVAVWDNILEERFAAAASATDRQIPAFAHRVRLDAADPNVLSSSTLDLYDAAGTKRASFTGSAQPGTGIVLGGATRLAVTCNAAHRLVYQLRI